MATNQIFEEFKSVVEDIYAIYLDSTMGYSQNEKRTIESQKKIIERRNITREEADNLPMIFGNGVPGDSEMLIVHQTTQKNFKERNIRHGKNYIALGNLCVVQLYQYWEDYYRKQITDCIGRKKNDIKSDFWRHEFI